jgi:hypothetical protein
MRVAQQGRDAFGNRRDSSDDFSIHQGNLGSVGITSGLSPVIQA